MTNEIFSPLLKRLIIHMDVTLTAMLAVNETLYILFNECIDSVLVRIELVIRVGAAEKNAKRNNWMRIPSSMCSLL